MPPEKQARRARVHKIAWWVLLDIAAFLLINSFFATSAFLVNPNASGWSDWLALFLSFLPSWGFWAAVTPALFWVSARVRMGSGRGLRPVMIHVALSVATLALYTLSELGLGLLGVGARSRLLEHITLARLAVFMLDYQWYWWITFAAHAYLGGRESVARALQASALQARTAELSERLVKAELDTLKAQLQPHFLFNTHNALAGLIRSGQNAAALELLTSLSDFLRYVLENRERDAVPLARELAFARKYLEIQRVRFHDRLQIEWDVDDACAALRVPSLLLQPLIENAVHHGVSTRRRQNLVRVKVEQRGRQLFVELVNSASRESSDHEGFGVGHANVVARLERMYGAAYSLELDLVEAPGDDEFMRLRLALPVGEQERVADG